MDLAEDLRASLQEILVRGAVELQENGSRSTPVWPLFWEVRGMPEKPLLDLWSENCNVTRRVLATTHHAKDRQTLAVERAASGLFDCTGAAFLSHNRRIAALTFPRNANHPRGPRRKLVPGTARDVPPINFPHFPRHVFCSCLRPASG